MALRTDPRFSDGNNQFADRRLDEEEGRKGSGLGLTLILTVAFVLLVFGAVEGLGFFDLDIPVSGSHFGSARDSK